MYGRKFLLKMKEKVSAILYGSETWCLREKEVAPLRRTKRAMMIAMSVIKLFDRKNTNKLMQMLELYAS